jgi:hypothetical protein
MSPHRLAGIALVACVLNIALPGILTAQTSRAATSGQSAPLMIGGKTFRTGMPQQEALALIAECCQTQGSPDSMFLLQKTGDFHILGTISFKNGRVSHLTVDVKQVQAKDASEFVLALYRTILDGQTAASGAGVTVSAYPQDVASAAERYVLLSYPNGRKIRLTQFSVEDGTSAVKIEEER